MLTYPCQSVVLKLLPYEKRCKLAAVCPELRTRHRKLPFYFEDVVISEWPDHLHLKIDNISTEVSYFMGETQIKNRNLLQYIWKTVSSKLSVEDVVSRILNYFFDRKGTIIRNLTLRWSVHIPRHLSMQIHNLNIISDEKIENWFHITKENKFKTVHLSGRSVFELIEKEEIQSLENITITASCTDIVPAVLKKLTKTRLLRFEFPCFLKRYHKLSEELLLISSQDRPIGSTIDYFVHDFFNDRLYPNFAQIVFELNHAKLKKLNGVDTITIPMEHAELNVFVVQNERTKTGASSWILRMVVMEKREG